MSSSTTKNVPINYTKEAFTHPVNLGVLLLATILGFLAHLIGIPTALALTVVCAAELLYLGIVPSMPQYRRMLELRNWMNFTPRMTINNYLKV